MAKYYKYFSTPEEHARAVMEALDKTAKEATKSKEAALAFLRRAGLIEDDGTEPKAIKKNSK